MAKLTPDPAEGRAGPGIGVAGAAPATDQLRPTARPHSDDPSAAAADEPTEVSADEPTADCPMVADAELGSEPLGPAAARPALTAENRQTPEWIGPFRVQRILGEGGMGAVYLGEQLQPVRREVALKVIHASLRSPVALARFDAERQAMARLSHPNVAALYEAGTTSDGFPYFAMEYLPGATLVQYCDRNRLDLRQRVALFAQVCDGVQHAHQKGLIHRDLKPSNLLVAEVDGQPVPKVIDFGIAKAVDQPLADRAELTGLGAIGTPAYMSPEAFTANQDLDTRTDVYSLGIVLYELLAGVRPHEVSGAALAQLAASGRRPPSQRLTARVSALDSTRLAEIARERRLTGSQLAEQLRADLDWIVSKAIDDERDRRYATVADLAADLRRFLANEAVQARPPSVRYRASKFVRRHRLGVIAAVLVLLALVLGIIGTSVGMLRAAQEAEAARQVAAFLTRLFEVSDPGVARGSSVTARELLDQGALRIQSELVDQPLIQARLMRTMAEVYQNLGLFDQAEPLETTALALRRQTLGSDDPEVGRSLLGLGTLRSQQGRYAEAETLLREAVSNLEDSLGVDSADLARAQLQLGLTRFLLDDVAQAELLYGQALATLENRYGPDSIEVASTLTHLGFLLNNQARHDQAEAVLARALRIREAALGSDHFLVEASLHLLADVYFNQGRLEQASDLYQRALAIKLKIYEPDHPLIAESHFALGRVRAAEGRVDEALTHLQTGIALVERSLGATHINLSRGLQPLGTLLANNGRWEEAAAAFRRLLEVYEAAVGPEHPWVSQALNNLGWVLSDGLADYAQAEPLLRRAVAILPVDSESQYSAGVARWTLANCLRDQHRHGEAQLYYEQALDLTGGTAGARPTGDPQLPALIADYARSLRADGREADAAALESRLR
jgi:non-specific serine/threonine protein kinase/serine/threonine-protein kinase